MIVRRLTDWPTWNWRHPFGELERMRKQMDDVLSGISKATLQEPFSGVFPLLNITEDANNYYVRAELPGMSSDELDISVTGTGLSISGERKIPPEGENVKYHRREREAGTFSRIISIPTQVKTEKVEAIAKDGILTVILPKSEETKPRQISVKTS